MQNCFTGLYYPYAKVAEAEKCCFLGTVTVMECALKVAFIRVLLDSSQDFFHSHCSCLRCLFIALLPSVKQGAIWPLMFVGQCLGAIMSTAWIISSFQRSTRTLIGTPTISTGKFSRTIRKPFRFIWLRRQIILIDLPAILAESWYLL